MEGEQLILKALVLDGPNQLRLEERREPSSKPGELRVRLRASGICGTDLSILSGKIPVAYPRVMGHEIVGVVEQGTDALPPGTRVVLDPNIYCGECRYCLAGRQNICASAELLGRDRDGGLAEVVSVPARNAYPLPPEVGDEAGAMIQVVTVCIHAQRYAPIFPGMPVLVMGLGVTGILHVQLSRQRGASPILGITRSAAKRKLAERLGADATFSPSDPGLTDAVDEATEGEGPAVVIETAGVPDSLALAIRLARPGGHIVAFGTLGDGTAELPFYSLYHKELTISSPRAALPEDFLTAIRLAHAGRLNLDEMITASEPLATGLRAFERAAEPTSMKVLIKPTEVPA